MKRLLIAAALACSFLLITFSWVMADGSEGESHTWDEKVGTISPLPPRPQATPPAGMIFSVGNWTVIILQNPGRVSGMAGQKLGKFNYLVIRTK